MLGRSKRTRETDAEGSSRQPLLNGSQEDLHASGAGTVLFDVVDDDEEDYVEASALDRPDTPPGKAGQSVRFDDNVQVRVFAPPIRSMAESREAGACGSLVLTYVTAHFLPPEYELDSDDLDDAALSQLETRQERPHRSRRDRDQAMPLLVGLLDSATARRSLDGTLQLERLGDEPPDEEIDLEELAAKRTAGGGMLDSVANMANSILGAGNARLLVPSLVLPATITHYGMS